MIGDLNGYYNVWYLKNCEKKSGICGSTLQFLNNYSIIRRKVWKTGKIQFYYICKGNFVLDLILPFEKLNDEWINGVHPINSMRLADSPNALSDGWQNLAQHLLQINVKKLCLYCNARKRYHKLKYSPS